MTAPSKPTSTRRGADAEIIVVGGGHNGLICAAYLARAGFDTLLVEARSSVGGCASTEEVFGARVNICHCDHTLVRAMPVIDELELTGHGLHYLEADAGSINVFHDGSEPWVHFHEVDRTLDSLGSVYPADVDGYRRYVADAMPVAQLAIDMARTIPSSPRMMSSLAGRRGAGARRLLEWSRRSAASVMSDYFTHWQTWMPAMGAGPTVWGVSPTVPGTGLAAAIYASRHLVKTGRPQGGSGALTDAVRASFEAAGGRVVCESRVERLLLQDGAVVGVRLTSGDEFRSATVVAACDPQRVFVDWIDEAPPAARKIVTNWRNREVHDGYESKIDAVLDGVPRPIYADQVERHVPGIDFGAPTTVVSPTPEGLEEAHRLRARGLVAPDPTMLVNMPTTLDDTMKDPTGRHVLSLEVLFTPYAHPDGWATSDEPDRWLDVWASLMEPGARELVHDWRAMTPEVYEREFSMYRGHTPAFAGSPLATLVGRTPELTRYRTPLDGLYLSGAATYPGAGIFGASGRNAAAIVTADLRGSVRRRVAPARRQLKRLAPVRAKG